MDHEVFLWSVSQFRLVFFFQARQAGEERARQATADLRRELEEVKLARQADADRHAQEEERARQADADLRKEVVEIKRLRRGDADLIAELKKLIQSEIGAISSFSLCCWLKNDYSNDLKITNKSMKNLQRSKRETKILSKRYNLYVAFSVFKTLP